MDANIVDQCYVSLTDIAKRYGKRLDNWSRLKSTRDLLSKNPGCIRRVTERSDSGKFSDGFTLARADIAKAFEEWCQKPPTETSTCVYLIWAVGSEMFKIGITNHPFSRAKAMQVGSPLKLIVSDCHRCDDAEMMEHRLHEAFKQYHSHGEWFEIPPPEAMKLFRATLSKWTVSRIAS